MRLLRVFRQRARSLFRSAKVDAELENELQYHLEQLTRENIAQGMEAGGGQRLLLAADALYFADPGVRVQVGIGEKLACVFLKSEISA